MDWKDLDRLRNPGFSFGRRGYDRHEVDRFLEQLVDWLETDAARDLGHIAITRKLELVGKSTAHILLTTEQEAQELRRPREAPKTPPFVGGCRIYRRRPKQTRFPATDLSRNPPRSP